MLFDRVVGFIERYSELSFLRSVITESKLFDLPGIPEEFLPKNPDNMEFYNDHFFLPFPTVAVEDKQSLVVLKDLEHNQVGLKSRRFFFEAVPMSTLFDHNEMSALARSKYAPDQVMLSVGTIQDLVYYDTGLRAYGYVYASGLYSKDPNKVAPLTEIPKKFHNDSLKSAICAIEEIMYFNDPNRFIVEVTPTKVRHSSGSKITRSHERPLYVILTPKEIKIRTGLSGSSNRSGSSKRAHPRRRHYRTLRSEKFVNKQGQVIEVRETWVGPVQAQVGNRIYKVLLDR